MCVIIYKPAGAKMPSKSTLDACYKANPHGCGFVSSTGQFFKSLNYEQFKERLMKVADEEECIIHFRLVTHGSIKKANCHPFKNGNVYFAHNGILPIKPIGDMTDSETAFRTILVPKIAQYGVDSLVVKCAVNTIIGSSKFAIMQNGKTTLFGNFIEQNGLYYSNLRFQYYMAYKSVI